MGDNDLKLKLDECKEKIKSLDLRINDLEKLCDELKDNNENQYKTIDELKEEIKDILKQLLGGYNHE